MLSISSLSLRQLLRLLFPSFCGFESENILLLLLLLLLHLLLHLQLLSHLLGSWALEAWSVKTCGLQPAPCQPVGSCQNHRHPQILWFAPDPWLWQSFLCKLNWSDNNLLQTVYTACRQTQLKWKSFLVYLMGRCCWYPDMGWGSVWLPERFLLRGCFLCIGCCCCCCKEVSFGAPTLSLLVAPLLLHAQLSSWDVVDSPRCDRPAFSTPPTTWSLLVGWDSWELHLLVILRGLLRHPLPPLHRISCASSLLVECLLQGCQSPLSTPSSLWHPPHTQEILIHCNPPPPSHTHTPLSALSSSISHIPWNAPTYDGGNWRVHCTHVCWRPID